MYGTLDFTKDISCKLIDDRFIIVSNNPDKLTFSSFRNELKNIDFSNTTGLDLSQIESLKALEVIKKRLVEEVIIPKNIVIKNTLRPVVTEGPTQEIKEIHYIKNDNYRTIQRYDGYITPTFIKLNDNKFYNFIYYKQEASDDIYNKITDYEGYDAVYPSIGYYFISKSAIDKYTPSNFEYRYFNNNKILILAKSIEKTIDSLEGVDKAVEKAIRVANNLEAKAALVKKNKYIYSLYKYTYEETEDKKYLIKIELK